MQAGRELDALKIVGKRGRKASRICVGCGVEFQAWMSDIERGRKRFCSHPCSERSKRKNPVQEFQGVRYYLSAQGYMENPDKGLKMHRVVWEHHNGAIPTGHLIHHKNGIKTDNRIHNLELQAWGDHTAEHSRERWARGERIGKKKKHFVCDAKDCDRPSKAKGLCTMHYQRMKAKERGKWL